MKRTRGDRGELARVEIVVEDRAGHVDVRTNHTGRNDHVVGRLHGHGAGAASVDICVGVGQREVSSVKGAVRANSVSGDVTATDTPKLESAKSMSGNVSVSGISTDGDVNAAASAATSRQGRQGARLDARLGERRCAHQ